jgi:SCF-associated factor 1
MHVDNPEQAEPTSSPFEVPGFSTTVRELKDIQGQFQRFGVFTASGEVLAGDVDYLKRCAEAIKAQPDLLESRDWSAMTDLLASRPRDVPALQHTGVIGLAYGDYHYHALHANGKITSYGTESQRCGSLGLGDIQAGARFRGLYRRNPVSRGDAYMCDIAYRRGRQVWFEPQRKDWLQWLEQRLQQLDVKVDGRTAQEILQGGSNEQAAFSEWIEQEGKHWDKGPVATPDRLVQKNSEAKQSAGDYSHLGAYFSIAIAAAGWHSGALVLVDEEQAHKDGSLWVATKQHDDDDDDDDSKSRPMPGAYQNHHSNDEEYVWTRDGFPKVRLPNGVELPGEGEARPWRDGMPTMRDLGLE